jgi:IS30 family transposase
MDTNKNYNKMIIQERRQKIWALTTRGMKGYEIAKHLKVDPGTVSRDIQYLTSQSQTFLSDLAKESLPFMYKTSIDGIRDVLKECWNIYESTEEQVNYFQRLAALKLAKECNEAQFKLLSEGPSIMYVQNLEEKLTQIETQIQQPPPQQPQQQLTNQISR